MSGVFAVDRGVFDHPIFAPEPFTEREAWLWMIGAAAWKKTRARCGRATVALERGQLAFSLRFMAKKWKWTEARVRRFLKRLEIDAMVTVSATRETTHITICNYDKFAFGRRTVGVEIDAPTDALATHCRRKEEEVNKDKKEEEKKVSSLRSERDANFAEFKKVYPKRDGSNPWKPAYDVYKRAVGRGVSVDLLLGSARGYALECNRKNITGTDKVAQALTWLRQERYLDYAPVADVDPSKKIEQEAFMASKGYEPAPDGGWRKVETSHGAMQ